MPAPARAPALLVLAALLLILAAPALAQTRVALVIGNSAYQHTARLANPVNDARAMGEVLRNLGFQVTERTDQDRAAMLAALREFGDRARSAEIALVFFAGHGMQVGRGGANAENFLIPVDARLSDIRDVEDEAIGLGRVLERMEGAANRIVILDACRDNPLLQRAQTLAGTRSVGRGLAPLDVGARGTLIAFATDPGRTASDGTGRNSPFTAALVQHLPTPGVEVRQALTRVRQQVVQATRGQQTPWTNDGLLQEVFLAQPPAPPAPAAAAPTVLPAVPDPAAQADALFWSGIQASRDVTDFEVYLQRFPNGLFRELAQRRIAALMPPPPRPLLREEIQEVQRRLAAMGLDPGPPDGTPGARLEEALQAFGLATGLPGPPPLNITLLPRIRQEPPPAPRRATALAELAEAALQRGDVPSAQRLATASLGIAASARGHIVTGEAAIRLGQVEAARGAFQAAQRLGSAEAAPRLAALPPRPLDRPEIQDVQRRLTAMGIDAGGTDGTVGPRLREALQAFGLAAGLSAAPSLDADLLSRVQRDPPPAPLRASALAELAETALRQGDEGGAQRLADASLRIAPTARGHLLAGDLARRRGLTEVAREAFLAAQRLGAAAAADRLAALPPRPLTRAEIQDVQRQLGAMGLDAGAPDGTAGPRLREALQAYAIAAGLASPPELDAALPPMLRREAPPAMRRAAALLDLGEAALRRGDAAAAQRLAEASLALVPTARAYLLSGDAAQQRGQTDAAREAYRAAQRLGDPAGTARLAAVPPRMLTRTEVQEVQRRLSALGLYGGPADGAAGSRLWEALQAYGIAAGFAHVPPLDGDLPSLLRQEAPPPLRRTSALLDLADIARRRGDPADAARLAAASLALVPTARGHILSGELALASGQTEPARAAFQAAQRLGAADAAALLAALPPRPLDRAEIRNVQQRLGGLGYDPGGTDGTSNPRLQEALRAFGIAAGLPAAPQLDAYLLARLERDAPPPARRAAALLDLADEAIQSADGINGQRLAVASIAIERTARGQRMLGEALQRQGQVDAAREAFRSAQQSGDPEAAARLAALPARGLTRAEVEAVQRRLAELRLDPGPADGTVTPRLRDSLQAYAIASGLAEPPQLDADLPALLRRDPPPAARRAEALLDTAEMARQRGDVAAARRLAEASLALQQTARGHMLVAEAALQAGQTEAARQAFQSAARLGATEAAARLAALPPRSLDRSEIQMVQRRLAAMGFDPGGTDGTPGPRLREALQAFAAAAELGGAPSLDAALLDHLSAEMPPAPARAAALLGLADAAARQGDDATVQRLVTASLAIQPTARAHLLAGEAAQRRGQIDVAREAFQAAQGLGSVEAAARLASLPQPPANRPLTRQEIAEAQRLLTAMGFDTAGTSGVAGPRSEEALRGFLAASGRPPGATWTTEILDALRQPPPAAVDRARALAAMAEAALRAGNPTDSLRFAQASQRLRPARETDDLVRQAQGALDEERRRAAQTAAVERPEPSLPAQPVPGTPVTTPGPAIAPDPPARDRLPSGPSTAFRCPPPGLRIVFDNGSTTRFRGATAQDPLICLRGDANSPSRWVGNFFPLPQPSEATMRISLSTLWPAEPGRSVTFQRTAQASGFNLAGDGWATGVTSQWRETFRVLRHETLTINGEQRRTAVIERYIEGIVFNNHLSTELYWWDLETAAWLQRRVTLNRGTTTARDYRAVRIEFE